MTNLGWTVLHAVWQITAIAGASAAALTWLHRAAPDLRSRVAGISLLLMAIVPAATACLGETTLGWQMRRAVTTSADPRINLGPLVETMPWLARDAAVVWIAGATLALSHLALSYARARRLAARGTTDVEPAVSALVDTVAATLQVARPVDVRYSSCVAGPLVLGARHPRILLPRDVVARLSPGQLAGVVTHELAHVKRGDYAANLLYSAISRLVFFHPAAWWMSARIREEREFCCDDAAIRAGRDAAGYAHALAALEDARDLGHLAVAARSGTLLHRIERLAGRSRRGLGPVAGLAVLVTAWTLAAVMLALLIIVPPSLPPGSKLRRRSPAPAGAAAPLARRAVRSPSGR